MADEIPTIPIAPQLPANLSNQSQKQNNLNIDVQQEPAIKPLPLLEEVEDIYALPKEEVQKQPFSSEDKPITATSPVGQTPEISKPEVNPARPNIFWSTIKAILLFLGIFVFIYLLMTFPAYWEKTKYFVKNFSKNKTAQTIEIPQIQTTNGDLFLSTIHQALQNVPEKSPETILPENQSQSTTTKETQLGIADLENNYLIIPKIEIKVPIVWNSPPDEEIMLKNLQKGVAHYNGTALPDQDNGNVFISGHSSYYWWDKGGYKTVFVNLGKLKNGDEIALAYNDKVYIYKVFEKIEVKPDQVEVLNQTDKPILSLMTCVPIGTNLRRLIIKAERIDVTSSEEKTKPDQKPEEEIIEEKPEEIPPPTPTTDKENLELLPWR